MLPRRPHPLSSPSSPPPLVYAESEEKCEYSYTSTGHVELHTLTGARSWPLPLPQVLRCRGYLGHDRPTLLFQSRTHPLCRLASLLSTESWQRHGGQKTLVVTFDLREREMWKYLRCLQRSWDVSLLER